MDEPDEFPQVTTWEGDCIEVLANFAECSIDAIVTDPPYALNFMGKDWDSFGDGIGFQKWCEQWARECLRVLKPGGHLLAFGGTRTYHREACAIEDAGFEIRDSLHWIYGTGFPKSRDISKAIDKEAGVEREVIEGGKRQAVGVFAHSGSGVAQDIDAYADAWQRTKPATDEAKEWEGWGTALKPAHEPIVVARKPLAAKHTVAANVLEYGTGAINVDGCKIGTSAEDAVAMERANTPGSGRMKSGGSPIGTFERSAPTGAMDTTAGRWPPNILLSHSYACERTGTRRVRGTAPRAAGGSTGKHGSVFAQDAYSKNMQSLAWIGSADADGLETVDAWDCAPDCPVAEVDRQSGNLKGPGGPGKKESYAPGEGYGHIGAQQGPIYAGETGGASRFFPCFRYQAKAPKKERPVVEGLPGHPTVKPVALMQWLVKLVTPPNGVVLDPFAGTGTTAEACLKEGFYCIQIERDHDSIRRIEARLAKYDTKEEAA